MCRGHARGRRSARTRRGAGRRITLARERGELRADADIQVLRDLLYGVIEYRLVHGIPIEPRYIDGVLKLAFDGVR